MIAESGPARIIEIDRDGVIHSETPLTVDNPHPHMDTRLARKIADDRYLVCHEGDGKVREYERGTGKVNVVAALLSSSLMASGMHRAICFNICRTAGARPFPAVSAALGYCLGVPANGHTVTRRMAIQSLGGWL